MKKYTVDELLKMDVVERAAAIKQLGCEEKRALFCSVLTLTEILGLDKIESYEERVRLRHEYILKYPDQEHWDYGEYITRRNKHKRMGSKASTHGNTISINTGALLSVRSNADRAYYNDKNELVAYFCSDDKNVYKTLSGYNLNRIIACTFLPFPDCLNNRTIGELDSNHINEDTLNNHIDNLDWTTSAGNRRHAKGYKDYQHSEFFRCYYPAGSLFEGISFITCRNDPALSPELLQIISSFADTGKTFRGFIVERITKEEAEGEEIGYPKHLLVYYDKHPELFDLRTISVICTAAAGSLKGRQFGVTGGKNHKKYFLHPQMLLSAIKTETNFTHGLIVKVGTLKEMLEIDNPLTPEEVKQYVQKYTYIIGPYKGVVVEGPHAGTVFYIVCKEDCGDLFSVQDMSRNAAGIIDKTKGCVFTKVSLEDVPVNYPTYPKQYDFCRHWLAIPPVENMLETLPFIISENDKTIPKKVMHAIFQAYRHNNIYMHTRYIPLTTMPDKDYPMGYPEGLLKIQMEAPELLDPNLFVSICTPITGRLKGKQFSVIGTTGLKWDELNNKGIKNALGKLDSYPYCCRWDKATIKKAQKIPEKLTLEILNDLKSLGRHVGPYKFTVNKGPFCGHVFYITCQKENIGNFCSKRIHQAINLKNSYMNCTIVKVNWEDVPPYPYNVLTEEVLKTLT